MNNSVAITKHTYLTATRTSAYLNMKDYIYEINLDPLSRHFINKTLSFLKKKKKPHS